VSDIQNLLHARSATHGNFGNVANTAQRIKRVLHDTDGWPFLSDEQAESLDMIAMKIARVLSGDPSHSDHWEDIEGYARLISNKIASDRAIDSMERSIREKVENDKQSTATTDPEN
jgi:hypothetical protein